MYRLVTPISESPLRWVAEAVEEAEVAVPAVVLAEAVAVLEVRVGLAEAVEQAVWVAAADPEAPVMLLAGWAVVWEVEVPQAGAWAGARREAWVEAGTDHLVPVCPARRVPAWGIPANKVLRNRDLGHLERDKSARGRRPSRRS